MLNVCALELITGPIWCMTDEIGPPATLELGKKPRQLCLQVAGHSWCHMSWYMLCCLKKKSLCAIKSVHRNTELCNVGRRRVVATMHHWYCGRVKSCKPLEAQGHVAVSSEKQTTPAAAGKDTHSLYMSLFPLSQLVSLSSEKQGVVVSADDETSGRLT